MPGWWINIDDVHESTAELGLNALKLEWGMGVSLPVETVHPELYHYTSIEGLRGILSTQSLWATNYRFLNDRTEIILFKEKLKAYLVPTAREFLSALIFDGKARPGDFDKYGGFEKACAREAQNFVETCFNTFQDEIYLTSFCGTSHDEYIRKHGLLSQWRGYGLGGGVCVEFDTRQLIELLKAESKRFEHWAGQVTAAIYGDANAPIQQQAELLEIVDVARDYFRAMCAGIVDGSHQPPEAGNYLPAFVNGIARYKHRAFKEEQEVRIVWVSTIIDEPYKESVRSMGGEPKAQKPTKYRGEDRIAYVDLLDGLGAELPIRRIIVGPQRDQESVALHVSELCKGRKIAVDRSEIPYVTR